MSQAHSYYDELPPSREPIEPIVTSWSEAFTIIGQAVVLFVLFAAAVFVILWAGAVVEAP